MVLGTLPPLTWSMLMSVSSLKFLQFATFQPTCAVLRTIQTLTCARGWDFSHSLENKKLCNCFTLTL